MITNAKLLILLAKQGSESAFRELYETHYEMIYRLAYRYVKSQPDAEDILQETFIKAFRAIQKFDFSISSNFSAWIYQICVRCSYDHHRKRKKRKSDQANSKYEPSPLKNADLSSGFFIRLAAKTKNHGKQYHHQYCPACEIVKTGLKGANRRDPVFNS